MSISYPIGRARIALSSVVLDIPDRTGRYIAKDSAGGWAYLASDAEGDHRHRGEGTCAGGLDMALRCAFLAAINCVPDCHQIEIAVESRWIHRTMVQLAKVDAHVASALGSRPLAVMTRPDERSVGHVRNAAERAAYALLRDREKASRQLAREKEASAVPAWAHVVADLEQDDILSALQNWREQQIGPASQPVEPPNPAGTARRNFGTTGHSWQSLKPCIHYLRQYLPIIGWTRLRRTKPRNASVAAWMRDLDTQVASVRSDLEGLGA